MALSKFYSLSINIDEVWVYDFPIYSKMTDNAITEYNKGSTTKSYSNLTQLAEDLKNVPGNIKK